MPDVVAAIHRAELPAIPVGALLRDTFGDWFVYAHDVAAWRGGVLADGDICAVTTAAVLRIHELLLPRLDDVLATRREANGSTWYSLALVRSYLRGDDLPRVVPEPEPAKPAHVRPGLTGVEVAAIAGVSRETVRAARVSGELIAITGGNHFYFAPDDVDRWIASRSTSTGAAP